MTQRAELARRRLVTLLWLYFGLLIAEGALRKWILPTYSDVLLIVRDPIAVLAIFLAARDGFLRVDGLVRSLALLFAAFAVLGGLQLSLGYTRSLPVLAFGLRTYFLHLPLIFIMASVLDAADLRRLVNATIVLGVPISLLMAKQFQSGPEDWINVGVGASGRQLLSVMGKVRPAGPFSYVTGPVSYFTLSFACLLASHIGRERMPAVLRWGGWGALLVAVAVSGSRSLIVGLVPVAIATMAAIWLRPRLVTGVVRAAIVVTAVAMVLWSISVVQEGVDVLAVRFETAGGTQELMSRSSNTYLYAQTAWTEAPLIGVGLGLGTNAGAAYLGRGALSLGEGEWTRVIYEAGPVLGLAYLAWRMWLALQLLRVSVHVASLGQMLPLALVGAVAMNLILGQWGQPTTQGFGVWGAGMCLAACRLATRGPAGERRVEVRDHA